MTQSHLNTAQDAAQKGAADRSLSFLGLKASRALELKSYDIDHCDECEKYAGASSIPLSAGTPAIMQARLSLPSLTLSLVKTFPRIVRGYRLPNAAIVAVPMDDVTSARINGRPIDNSVLFLKGDFESLVHEPESRLLAIFYLSPFQREPWADLSDGYHLLNPASDVLASLRRLVTISLETASNDPDFLSGTSSRLLVEQSLLSTLDAVIRTNVTAPTVPPTIEGYWRMVSEMETLIRRDLRIWSKTTELAAQVGVSVRTLQSATQAICGMSPHRYSRVLRLWSVRQQLREGPGRRSVKSCAIAHGFWHLSEFAASYKAAFAELPSETLQRALR